MTVSLKLVLALGLSACVCQAAHEDQLEAELEALREQFQSQKGQVDALVKEFATMQKEHEHGQEERKLAPADLGTALTCTWLILCGTLVMFMHAGFAMLETGCCRAKSASNVLMKNLLNVCAGTIAWWLFGWGFAYGGEIGDDGYLKSAGGFIGDGGFAAHDFVKVDDAGNQTPQGTIELMWFFQWAFCTAAATIVSGGVAERVQSPTYVCYSFIMASFIYPCVVAWTWSYGWIAKIEDIGYIDFAGSGIVHLTGGVSALAGAIVLGPRKGRFENPDEFAPHSLPLVVLGTLSLWFGWYGFNCGSTLGMADGATGLKAAHVAMNTTLSAAAGGLTVFLLRFLLMKKYDVGGLCNGILAGLVSITAGCSNVESGSALLIGILGGIVYQAFSMMLVKMKVDDPVDASSVHGAAGIWGVLAAAIFDMGNGFDTFHGWNGFGCMTNDDGSCQKGIWGTAFGIQIVLILAVVVWAGTLSGLAFLGLKMTGMLRVSEDQEEVGLDEAKHSPPKAYSIGGAAGTAPAKPTVAPTTNAEPI